MSPSGIPGRWDHDSLISGPRDPSGSPWASTPLPDSCWARTEKVGHWYQRWPVEGGSLAPEVHQPGLPRLSHTPHVSHLLAEYRDGRERASVGTEPGFLKTTWGTTGPGCDVAPGRTCLCPPRLPPGPGLAAPSPWGSTKQPGVVAQPGGILGPRLATRGGMRGREEGGKGGIRGGRNEEPEGRRKGAEGPGCGGQASPLRHLFASMSCVLCPQSVVSTPRPRKEEWRPLMEGHTPGSSQAIVSGL